MFLPNPRIHWVLKDRSIAFKKGNNIAFLSLKYRLFQKPLEALIYKGCSCFMAGVLPILLFFRTLADFWIDTSLETGAGVSNYLFLRLTNLL